MAARAAFQMGKMGAKHVAKKHGKNIAKNMAQKAGEQIKEKTRLEIDDVGFSEELIIIHFREEKSPENNIFRND